MKLVYDALLRAVVLTILTELVSIPFIKLTYANAQTVLFDILIVAVPAFIAMLIYNLIEARLRRRNSRDV